MTSTSTMQKKGKDWKRVLLTVYDKSSYSNMSCHNFKQFVYLKWFAKFSTERNMNIFFAMICDAQFDVSIGLLDCIKKQYIIICKFLNELSQWYLQEFKYNFILKYMGIWFELLDIFTHRFRTFFVEPEYRLSCNIECEDHISIDSCRNSRNISLTKSYKQSIDIFTDCLEKYRVNLRLIKTHSDVDKLRQRVL
jgi:hypothetical protein